MHHFALSLFKCWMEVLSDVQSKKRRTLFGSWRRKTAFKKPRARLVLWRVVCSSVHMESRRGGSSVPQAKA